MTKAVLGIIGGSGIYDLAGPGKVRSKNDRKPVGRAVGRVAIGEIAGCRSCFCRATTRAIGFRRPTSITAPISTCSSAPA